MFKKLAVFLFLFFCLIMANAEIKLNTFLEKNDDELLTKLFTVNVGIMNFKHIGNIKSINPLDSQNCINAIKLVIEKIPSIKLNRKAAAVKAANVLLEKTNEDKKEKPDFIKRKLLFSDWRTDQNIIYELFLELRKHEEFYPIARKWFENIENPFYVLNISDPMERILLNEEQICQDLKVNNEGPIDFLIHGEIEKIDNIYFITIFIYSNLLKKRVKEISFVTDSENIMNKTMERVSVILPSVFLIDYASLNVNTEDEETRVYFDTEYIGKGNVQIDFIIPGDYIVTLKKENYEDKLININLTGHEKKEINENIDKEKELQIIYFYIEPLGTKIFIDSVYQGKTPFKKALPKGKYVISAKNNLYESYRYILSIDEVKKEEITVVFHLKTKDIRNFFKIKRNIYYAAFWNFTFSLTATIPILIFTFDQWFRTQTQTVQNLTAYYVLYGFSVVFVTHTILSLGWLFYALADYLLVLEKRDFIPIIDFYHDLEGKEGVSLGLRVKL